MNEIIVLPEFAGMLCHDHWKTYDKYDYIHAFCNAHHLRKLIRVWEQDNPKWAIEMRGFLGKINNKVINSGRFLNVIETKKYR